MKAGAKNGRDMLASIFCELKGEFNDATSSDGSYCKAKGTVLAQLKAEIGSGEDKGPILSLWGIVIRCSIWGI